MQTAGRRILEKSTPGVWIGTLLFLLLFAVWFLPSARSRLYENLIWVELSHFIFDKTSVGKDGPSYVRFQVDTPGDTAGIATGRLLYTFLTTPLLQRESGDFAADTFVSDSLDWARILAVGEWLYSQARYQESMRVFAGVSAYPAELRDAWRTDANLAIGSICQVARFSSLGGGVEREIVSTCASYWDAVNDNLIVNADFNSGHLRPWFQRHQRGIQYSVARDISERTGEDDFSAAIRSAGTGVYGGIYQNLSLPPNSRVRFSARLRVEAESGAINIAPLYIRGEIAGNDYWRRSLPSLTESTEWIELENVYRIPADHQGPTAFYPVFFTGVGRVWVDDIRVEMLESDE